MWMAMIELQFVPYATLVSGQTRSSLMDALFIAHVRLPFPRFCLHWSAVVTSLDHHSAAVNHHRTQ